MSVCTISTLRSHNTIFTLHSHKTIGNRHSHLNDLILPCVVVIVIFTMAEQLSNDMEVVSAVPFSRLVAWNFVKDGVDMYLCKKYHVGNI